MRWRTPTAALLVCAAQWMGAAPQAVAQSTAPAISRQERESFYEEAKLSHGNAVLYSLALPGLGNFYAERYFSGVLLMSVFGFGLTSLLLGLTSERADSVLIGTTLIVGAQATGAWMSWQGVTTYNDLLRQRYDLKPQASGPMLQWAWRF